MAGKQPAVRQRRRLVVGPGVMVALIVILALAASGKFRDAAQQKQLPQQGYTAVISGPGPIPDVRYIVDRKDELSLSDEQVSRVRQLADESEEKMDRINDDLAAKTSRLDELEKQKGSEKRNPGAGFDADGLSGLLREAAQIRSGYWKQATALLTAQQRAKLEKLRERDWKGRMHDLEGKPGR